MEHVFKKEDLWHFIKTIDSEDEKTLSGDTSATNNLEESEANREDE